MRATRRRRHRFGRWVAGPSIPVRPPESCTTFPTRRWLQGVPEAATQGEEGHCHDPTQPPAAPTNSRPEECRTTPTE